MSINRIAFIDANIVIDYSNGIPQAAAELAQYKQAFISPITWVEAQVKSPPGLEEATRRAIDANFKRIELDEAALTESLNLRRTHRLKLPDAMIWASAKVNGSIAGSWSRAIPSTFRRLGADKQAHIESKKTF